MVNTKKLKHVFETAPPKDVDAVKETLVREDMDKLMHMFSTPRYFTLDIKEKLKPPKTLFLQILYHNFQIRILRILLVPPYQYTLTRSNKSIRYVSLHSIDPYVKKFSDLEEIDEEEFVTHLNTAFNCIFENTSL